MGGESNANIGDKRRTTRSTFLDDIDNIAPVQNREMGAFAQPVNESRHDCSPDEGKRLLPQVSRTQIVDSGAERPTPITVHDKTVSA